jgi:hypothetical protein
LKGKKGGGGAKRRSATYVELHLSTSLSCICQHH